MTTIGSIVAGIGIGLGVALSTVFTLLISAGLEPPILSLQRGLWSPHGGGSCLVPDNHVAEIAESET